MASFQKYTTKKEGTLWMYKYYSTIDPVTGKKKPSTKRGFKTKKEAQLDAAKTEQDIANGTFINEDKQITFEQNEFVVKEDHEEARNYWDTAEIKKFLEILKNNYP